MRKTERNKAKSSVSLSLSAEPLKMKNLARRSEPRRERENENAEVPRDGFLSLEAEKASGGVRAEGTQLTEG